MTAREIRDLADRLYHSAVRRDARGEMEFAEVELNLHVASIVALRLLAREQAVREEVTVWPTETTTTKETAEAARPRECAKCGYSPRMCY